ncbi:class II fumarate hydratase [Stappia sp.]|uniref:class II fumarate hydratase n=1 Tax=Stappia sp. TaxID=1870903 RepID=UPI0032D90AD3
MTQTATRRESDSMGPVDVPADRYWGAQTERARHRFAIGTERFPLEIVHALARIKAAAARVNADLGVLPADLATPIAAAAQEVVDGRLDGEFPLSVWISGSGTQANMNVNEVIANRAIEMMGGVLGSKEPVHPNDHVNRSQSSNDVVPSAVALAAALLIERAVRPAAVALRDALADKAETWHGHVKIGRTHLMDAVPMTLGQEFAGYAGLIDANLARLDFARDGLLPLAIGGTAVGTGLNAPAGFAEAVAADLARQTGLDVTRAANPFAAMGSHDALVMASGALRTLAVSLHKIANDIRLLACGPRAGFAELLLPENEPGSSIMPGKVNPTQCEALAMLTVQVMGLDTAVAMGGAGGHLEMNVYKPLIGHNVVTAARLLSDGMTSFTASAVRDMEVNTGQLETTVGRSLMLVTALAPEIGYDMAARVAHRAHHTGTSLREAALALEAIDAATFDRIVDPGAMTGDLPPRTAYRGAEGDAERDG